MADVRDAARQVGGEIAHDAASAGKPVFVGGYASSSAPTAVSANGDMANLWVDLNGRPQVVMGPSSGGVGMDAFRNSAVLASAIAVKSSAGNLYMVHIENSNSSKAYLQFYDLGAGSVVVGTTTPTLTLLIPATGGYDGFLPVPFAFATAISIAATTTATGGTAPGTGLLVNIGYK